MVVRRDPSDGKVSSVVRWLKLPIHVLTAGEMSAVNRGAIIDLIREAEMLASMRHPNIVWVYGELRPGYSSATAACKPSSWKDVAVCQQPLGCPSVRSAGT